MKHTLSVIPLSFLHWTVNIFLCDLNWVLWCEDIIMNLRSGLASLACNLFSHMESHIQKGSMLGFMLCCHCLEHIKMSSLNLCFLSELWGDVHNMRVCCSVLLSSQIAFKIPPWTQNSSGPMIYGVQWDSKQVSKQVWDKCVKSMTE